jgi:DNA replication protein DnaC
MLNAGINTEYQRLLWDDMTHVNLDAQDQVGEYITNLDYNIRIGRGLILWSKTPGTGKTLLGSLIVKRSLARGVDCYLTQFNEMLDIFTSGWRDEDERAWFIRRIRNVTLLAVDDIGKESGGRSNVVDSMFDTVMRHRVASGLPTLITTNLTPKEIQQGYGMYVMSLLSEQCEDIEVPGMDYRPKKREKNTMLAVNKIVRPFAADL